MPTKKVKSPRATKKAVYEVEIDASGESRVLAGKGKRKFKAKRKEVYKANGNDLYALLAGYEAPALVNTEHRIKVTKNGKTVQKSLKVVEARRCFAGYETTSLELLAIGIDKMLP